jgi:hypothetical protein
VPKPFQGQVTNRSSAGTLIRASKSEFIRCLYARLGPEEFYRRRLDWLQANKKTTSYGRLVDYLRRAGLVVSPHT